MSLIEYIPKRFSNKSMIIIQHAMDIINEYSKSGFTLTLRQLFYQFVSRDFIENTQKSYTNLGNIINDARLAGYIDWEAIEDRTRFVRSLSHWNNVNEIIKSASQSYRMDKWKNQKFRPEVWIEKDALVGVIEKICNDWDIPYFSCRGYTSQSEMWQASQRFIKVLQNKQIPYIIHLGDHDPSGIDMTRDISDRIGLFLDIKNGHYPIQRLALNINQVEENDLPPNPAKLSDTRSYNYIGKFGNSSWELDALEPNYIVKLIDDAIIKIIDMKKFNEIIELEKIGKEKLLNMIKE